MPSDIGAEPDLDTLAALPSDGWRLIVGLAAALRYAPFMSVFAHDQKSVQLADVRSELVAACAKLDSADIGSARIDGDVLAWGEAMPDVDPDAWVTSSGPDWLGSCHIDSLTNTVDYAQTLDPVHVQFALGSTLETVESWAENDLDRRGVVFDRAQPADWLAEKYSFPPVVMELGAQRLDLTMAGSRQPDAAQLILRRAETHGRWFADFYDAWAGDEVPWRR
jgi:hypothetical protein